MWRPLPTHAMFGPRVSFWSWVLAIQHGFHRPNASVATSVHVSSWQTSVRYEDTGGRLHRRADGIRR
ncbi:hypothetical protein ACWD25_54500 [Streptomyces sp. NPDC002920]